jgi:hypothetical protein
LQSIGTLVRQFSRKEQHRCTKKHTVVPRRCAHGGIVRYEVSPHENWRTDLYTVRCVPCLLTGKDDSIETPLLRAVAVIGEVLFNDDTKSD